MSAAYWFPVPEAISMTEVGISNPVLRAISELALRRALQGRTAVIRATRRVETAAHEFNKLATCRWLGVNNPVARAL